MSLIGFLRRRLLVRRVIVLAAHLVLYAAAFLLAFLVRFDFSLPETYARQIAWGLSLAVFFRTVFGLAFRLYGGVLKYAGIGDLVNIVKAMSLASVALVVAVVILGIKDFPRSIFLLDWAASIALVGGLRFGLRIAREALTAPAAEELEGRRRVAIVGAGDAGEALARDLLRGYRDRYELVGFFDDNPRKQGLTIHGVPVLAPIIYLGDMVPRRRIQEVIIAIPTASGEVMRGIVSACQIAGVKFRTLPGVDQLLDGAISVNLIRDVAIEDLLGREPVHLEEGELRRFLRDKRVMVTGAGGSIGAELCRQILRFAPASLLLVEQSEPNLFFIHREMTKRRKDLPVVPLIADVLDRPRMEKIFAEHRPQVIFHAAAHKHVPMMEWNPGEAVKNNVLGTKTVAELAHQFEAEAFVFVSTDKAVNPTSVMGATKRVAEMFVQALAQESRTVFAAVRFGNVLGSVGSVVPIFKEQIAAGGPVTVTHPEMKRYFMTIPEATQLVMQAAAMGEGGEIFVLDMGQPVRIVDLARDLIRLSGLTPDRDVRIEFTGLRPGEKLFEEIGFDAEKMDKTRHPKIYTGRLLPVPRAHIEERVRRLLEAAASGDPARVRAELRAAVPEYQPTEAAPLPAPAPDVSGEERVLAQAGARNTPEGLPAAPRAAPAAAEPQTAGALAGTDPQGSEAPARPRGGAAGGEGERAAAFGAAWEKFAALCRERGFAGAAWKTMGMKPADQRQEFFNGDGAHLSSVTRSVAVTSLLFIELRFFYRNESGKKPNPEIKQAVRDVVSRISLDLAALHRVV